MSVILKPVAVHAIVGNAPKIISVQATAAPAPMRTFVGTGAPSGSTLLAGNGMYNGTNSGFIVNASIDAAGSGYVIGDVLTGVGGSGTQIEITVDMVTAAGAIMDFHVNVTGSYSAYPGATITTIGGTGSGATFFLNVPSPDYYLDMTTPATPVEYVCTTSGSNSASVWAKVSGSGGGVQCTAYDTTGATAYSNGAMVYVIGPTTVAGILVRPGTYVLVSGLSTPASPTGNQVPQIPAPSGTIYWWPIAAGMVQASTCQSGLTVNFYANATSPF